MSTLIGTAPDQVPVNGMLGDMAFQSKAAVTIGTLTSKGTTTSDAPTLGTEFITSSASWTTSTGWTGNNTTGWVHATGNSGTLTYPTAAVSGTRYQIAFTVTSFSAGSFTVTFGGQSLAGITATGTFGPTATTTGNLVITPTSTFVGTIVVSIKAITAASTALITALDSTGSSRFEMRATTGTGFNNTFLGLSSGFYNTTGTLNTSIGVAALAYNTTGQGNSAVGFNALITNTTGIFNTAVGARALQANTIGNSNSAFGLLTLAANTTGTSNCAFGQQALTSNTTGISNVAVGLYALLNNTTGSSNTAIGNGAGQVIANGSTTLTVVNNSTYVGYATRASADNVTNETVIGYAAVGSGSNTITLGGSTVTGTIIPYGNVGINTSSPSAKLQIGDSTVNIGNRLIFGRSVTCSESHFPLISHYSDGSTSDLALVATSTSGNIRFFTGNNTNQGEIATGTNTEKMRIDASGNVGIGTSSPYSQLDVYSGIASPTTGEASGVGSIRITNGASVLTSAGGLEFKIAGDSNGYGSKIQALNSGGSQLVFANRQASATWIERMRIDSSGNVGIGTSNPSAVLQIASDATGTDFRSFSSKAGIALNFTGTGVSYYDSDTTVFRTSAGSGSTTRMIIDPSGNVTLQKNISVGAAAPTTSGTGITFPATQAASSNANTLDDYEEGTWTPVLSFVTNGTMTYTASTASGVYTKIGNVVTCRVALGLSAFTAGTASGQARISLPFTSAQNYFTAKVYVANFTTTFPTLVLSAGAVSYVNVYGNTAINTAPVGIAPANFSATSSIFFSITYTV